MKNKNNIILGLFIVTILSLGVATTTNANTYQYINSSKQLSEMTADSSKEALRTADGLSLHSGVILVNEDTSISLDNDTGSYIYQYINTSGQLSSMRADSPQEAIRTADGLSLHSGVIFIQ